MVQQVKTWYDKLGVWSTLLTFAVGFLLHWGVSIVTIANRVDFLTQKVADLNGTVQDLQRNISSNNQQTQSGINAIGNRATALEVKVFGKPQLP